MSNLLQELTFFSTKLLCLIIAELWVYGKKIQKNKGRLDIIKYPSLCNQKIAWHSMISNQIFPEKSLWLFRWVFDSKQNIYTTFLKQKCARPHPVVLYIYNPFYFLPIFHIHSLGYITPGPSKLLQETINSSRIDRYEGHWCGSTYMIMRLSDLSSKTGKICIFWCF